MKEQRGPGGRAGGPARSAAPADTPAGSTPTAGKPTRDTARTIRQQTWDESAIQCGTFAHLQGATASSLTRAGPAGIGPLLETLVATELIRQLSWADVPASLGHFRDRSGVEVDLVLEHPDGRIAGVEVKATSTPRAEDLRGLRFLAERLGTRFAYGCLLTLAGEATPFGKQLAVLPISALWEPIS